MHNLFDTLATANQDVEKSIEPYYSEVAWTWIIG